MYDVAIIGGGPSGLTASIYAKRAGLSVVVIENYIIGGQIALSHNVENYSGFISISGMDLADKFFKQAESLGVEFVYDNITSLDLVSAPKTLVTAYSGTIVASTIIIATGAKPKMLGLPREEELIGAGISYCATCDGAFFKNKDVLVVGGGNTAIQDAIYLKKFANSVTVIHRRDTFRAESTILNQAKELGISFLINTIITSLNGSPLNSITIKNTQTNVISELDTRGLFVAVGQSPNTSLFKDTITLQDGYILASENTMTNVNGVFAAGDVRVKHVRQVITACSDGAVASEHALLYISSLNSH